MFRILFASSLMALALSPVAAPQSTSQAARSFLRFCVDDLRSEGFRAPEAACGCGFGYMAARLTPRQMRIFSQMAPYLNDERQLQAVVANMVQQQGYTPQEIMAVGNLIEGLGVELDPVCGPLER